MTVAVAVAVLLRQVVREHGPEGDAHSTAWGGGAEGVLATGSSSLPAEVRGPWDCAPARGFGLLGLQPSGVARRGRSEPEGERVASEKPPRGRAPALGASWTPFAGLRPRPCAANGAARPARSPARTRTHSRRRCRALRGPSEGESARERGEGPGCYEGCRVRVPLLWTRSYCNCGGPKEGCPRGRTEIVRGAKADPGRREWLRVRGPQPHSCAQASAMPAVCAVFVVI
ncbi:uncharacterized protein LOC119870159 isoform X1 [Canis lupus familiaris]|uniref:uncharacterized protein LOC112643471 n=1 Tax=Canis lupus dingo TaxID=286419 RepID=UPI0018F50E78|nr:uncharacterized protein LOC119870159 isoform X1 [Canis lupus familiaris]XP_038381418.1 uncharacterized protein LOC119870159 isoform X1 [Canis lupus familiaris]XP_038509526.1 uncharacterized protein LOC119870159 isoform X1 [Canis lupus familiaris]XP_048948896.1 uncharacterized protein LOC112643471 [Canis lupus dingo]